MGVATSARHEMVSFQILCPGATNTLQRETRNRNALILHLHGGIDWMIIVEMASSFSPVICMG